MRRRPRSSTLFPYTTLFRSSPQLFFNYWSGDGGRSHSFNTNGYLVIRASSRVQPSLGFDYSVNRDDRQRSEEHTSELQSRENLVCRLLLEKKKEETNSQYPH